MICKHCNKEIMPDVCFLLKWIHIGTNMRTCLIPRDKNGRSYEAEPDDCNG